MKANCGDGSDGTVDLDGTSNPTGWATRSGSGSGATYTLTRDIFCANLTISNACTLLPAGFRIFVRGRLYINSGCAIRDDGNHATLGTAGAGLAAAGPTRYSGSGAGGAGGPGYGGSSGQGPSLAGYSGLPNGMTTYNGGNGGSSGMGQGGFGGSPYQLVDIPPPRSAAWYDTCVLFGGSGSGYASGRLACGSGGGGGSAVTNGIGGGGGGGGGGIVISAWEIENDGEISVRGGNAGDGSGTAAAGGGGGGSGGYIAILYNTATGSGLGTRITTGGTGGNPLNGGASGQAGDSGPSLTLQETT